MPIGVDGWVDPNIGSMQGTLQISQAVRRECIIVLMELKNNPGLWIGDFVEPQLAGKRPVARCICIMSEPELQNSQPVGDNRRQGVNLLGQTHLIQCGIEATDRSEQ